MQFWTNFFQRRNQTPKRELIKPYRIRAKEAILRDDLPKAIAYLSRSIELAPDQLDLYLQRAQVFQYGLNNFSSALEDYRFILRTLEGQPQHNLVAQCRQAIKDMMSEPAL